MPPPFKYTKLQRLTLEGTGSETGQIHRAHATAQSLSWSWVFLTGFPARLLRYAQQQHNSFLPSPEFLKCNIVALISVQVVAAVGTAVGLSRGVAAVADGVADVASEQQSTDVA